MEEVAIMTRMVKCIKLGVEAEGLAYSVYPGELGKKIYDNGLIGSHTKPCW